MDNASAFPAVITFAQAVSAADIAVARTLFKEYEQSIGVSLCFQNFDQELANLPGDYAPPSGRLLLVRVDDQIAGCIALRKLDDSTSEMKRLYLRPEFRGRGLGEPIVQTLIHEAKLIGYSKIRLDTIPGRMDQAINLYRSIGFKEIPAYYDTPFGDTLYMELDLTSR
jgi:ribosomal protein S18 acetylase RimI-like enzyme